MTVGYLRLVDDSQLYDVDVKRSAPGHLAWDAAKLREEMPEVFDDVQQLIDRNFASDLFAAPQEIEAETQARLIRVTKPKLIIPAKSGVSGIVQPSASSSAFIDD